MSSYLEVKPCFFMSFAIYCYYLMNIGRIHAYGRAMKRLQRGFVIYAHRKFSPRSINALRRCAASSIYGTLAGFTGAFIALGMH